jgi:hypothetical protein
MNWNATCAAASAPKSGAIPTSGAITKAETIASVLAAQIRSQGIACDEPQKATRDAKPDYDVWVLTCKPTELADILIWRQRWKN